MSPKKNKRRAIHPWYQPMAVRISVLWSAFSVRLQRVVPVIRISSSRIRPVIETTLLRTGWFLAAVWRLAMPLLLRAGSLLHRIQLRRRLGILKQWITPILWRATARIRPLIARGIHYLDPRIVRLENPDHHRFHTAIISGAMLSSLILAATLAACS